jgi:hypothetical protein
MPGLLTSIITAQGDGTALANSTSATSILPAAAKFTFPANYLDFVGRKLRVTAQGRLSNIVTTPGTLTLDLRLGATVVFNGGAMQMSTTAHTSVPWWWEVEVTVRAIGSSASLMGQGMFFSQAASISGADPTTGHSFLMTPNTAPAVGNTFDSTAALALDLFAKFSVNDAANSITLHQYEVQSNVSY